MEILPLLVVLDFPATLCSLSISSDWPEMLRSHRGRTGWHGFRVSGLRTGLLTLLAGAQFEWFGLKSGAPAESKAVISDCIKTLFRSLVRLVMSSLSWLTQSRWLFQVVMSSNCSKDSWINLLKNVYIMKKKDIGVQFSESVQIPPNSLTTSQNIFFLYYEYHVGVSHIKQYIGTVKSILYYAKRRFHLK